jgi:hypothetical protein
MRNSGAALLGPINGFMILPFLSPLWLICGTAGLKEAKNLAGEVLRLIQDRLSDAEFGKNLANLSNQFAASADR